MTALDGYLLDNNVISVLARPSDSRYVSIEARLSAIGRAPVMLPVIAIAEIEFGMAKATNPDPVQQAQFRAFSNQYPLHLGIDDNLVLATMDQNEGMKRIDAAAKSLAEKGHPISLRISYWS